jgi:hypothetical protein
MTAIIDTAAPPAVAPMAPEQPRLHGASDHSFWTIDVLREER